MTSVRSILAFAVALALSGCVEVQVPYRLPPPVVEAPPVACPPTPPLPDCACPDADGRYRDADWRTLLDRAEAAVGLDLCQDIAALIAEIPRECRP